MVNMLLNYKIKNGTLSLLRDRCRDADHYRIMGMSETFAYSSVVTTQSLIRDLDISDCKYIRFRIIAESEDNNYLEESNEVNTYNLNIENFEIAALYGYHGTTLTFRSKAVYDLYKIYNKNSLIGETEDPIFELSYKITKKELNDITVEGYTKIEDDYVLCGVSCGITRLPERKKGDYKISLVIPVYNAAVFLPRTLDSILSSSMPDIGVILVNDGSKDESLDVCNWYAKEFPCVTVINQVNQGVSVARNNGMAAVKSEYIGFVDSDDIIHPFMYENLYDASKLENTDIAIATTIIRNDVCDKKLCLDIPNNEGDVIVYTYDDVINNMHTNDNIYFVAVRNKIVRREIAEQIKFPEDFPSNVILYEDSAYTPVLYSYADNFAFCKNAYYIWDKRQRKTVGTLSTRHKNNDDVRKAFIYTACYPIYNSCNKHKELCDYACFKDLIKSYDKFNTTSPLLDYWNKKLKELITKQKLDKNSLIMSDEHLKEVINKVKNI